MQSKKILRIIWTILIIMVALSTVGFLLAPLF